MVVTIIILVFCLSVFLTWLVKRYSIANSLMDVPNHRSSHEISTPRGGGLGVAIIMFAAIIYLFVIDYLSINELTAISMPVFIVALSGWIDDHKHIPSLIRAAVYLFSSAWLVYFFNIENRLISILVLSLFITWVTNLYNFMDGIDGLAAIEALTTSAFAFFIFYHQNEFSLYIFSALLFSSVAGFLVWNWPPAKIFMGDVGSCTLGLLFSVLAMLAYQKIGVSISVWLILLSVFIADATFTLIKRILKKEKWYSAHRQHGYQVLVQAGFSHRFITLSVGLLNILFLWPLAYYVFVNQEHEIFVLAINYLLLFLLWIYVHIYCARRLTRDTQY